MPRVEALAREELAEFEDFFALVEGAMGFVPNSMLTLGRRPEIMRAFAALSGSVLMGGELDPALKQLVAFVASNAAGCRYCQAHTAHGSERAGVPPEKLAAAFEFETNDLFCEAERAALRLARDASLVPNEVHDAHFDALRAHFDDGEIVELMAVVSLFGWLNRWNDSLSTELESGPLALASERLAPHGWQASRHLRD